MNRISTALASLLICGCVRTPPRQTLTNGTYTLHSFPLQKTNDFAYLHVAECGHFLVDTIPHYGDLQWRTWIPCWGGVRIQVWSTNRNDVGDLGLWSERTDDIADVELSSDGTNVFVDVMNGAHETRYIVETMTNGVLELRELKR